jgi:acetyl-CoA/propionyl-CoA carboxylase biotin carboxyl carrier protein
MFDRVLIANRGEIAIRIARTLRKLGIEAIAVFSDADADAPHLAAADLAYRIGPAAASESYLNIERLLDAAQRSRAQAIHPGYGFLSERADFARACRAAGLTFIGPSPEAIELLGDKAAAKRTARAAGVPVVEGLEEALDDERIAAWAQTHELPVMLKAAGGGGGRGMRVVRSLAELPDALAAARREAQGAFGDPRLIVERYVERARHIEVQVIADEHGAVLHLGERECSLQRRHQKVIEEAPSPVVDGPLRESLGAAAVALARHCSYTNAGTVELIADSDEPARFSFLEMNARLQVEHPVTEAVTGLDLVELQLRIAAGEPLPLTQEQVRLQGHAIEARIYAEDPANSFLPSSGRVVAFSAPADLRFDGAVAAGVEVGTAYDSMLAKAVAHAPTRDEALNRLDLGLARTELVGVQTNIAWLRSLLAREEVRRGELDTTLLQRLAAELDPPSVDPELLAGLATVALVGAAPSDDPWAAHDGWRSAGTREPATTMLELGEPAQARVLRGEARPRVDGAWRVADARVELRPEGLRVTEAGGETRTVSAHRDGDAIWLVDRGVAVRCAPARRTSARSTGSGSLQAPMPGTVIDVRVALGERVAAGAPLLVLESMKMELTIASPRDGVISALTAAVGDRVAQGELLLELDDEDASSADAASRDPAGPATGHEPARTGPGHEHLARSATGHDTSGTDRETR